MDIVDLLDEILTHNYYWRKQVFNLLLSCCAKFSFVCLCKMRWIFKNMEHESYPFLPAKVEITIFFYSYYTKLKVLIFTHSKWFGLLMWLFDVIEDIYLFMFDWKILKQKKLHCFWNKRFSFILIYVTQAYLWYDP